MFFYCNVCLLETKKDSCTQYQLYLDGLIGPRDEGNKQREHHVDEEGDEGVQVHLTKKPHQCARLLHLRERHEHVITVNEREEAL